MSNSVRAAVLGVLLSGNFTDAAAQQPFFKIPELPAHKNELRYETTYQQDWAQAIRSANEKNHLEAMDHAALAAQKFIVVVMAEGKPFNSETYKEEFGIKPLDFYHDQLIAHVRNGLDEINDTLASIKKFEEAAPIARQFAIENGAGDGEAEGAEFMAASSNYIRLHLEEIDAVIRRDVSKMSPVSDNDAFSTLLKAGISPATFYALCREHNAKVITPDLRLGAAEMPKATLGQN